MDLRSILNPQGLNTKVAAAAPTPQPATAQAHQSKVAAAIDAALAEGTNTKVASQTPAPVATDLEKLANEAAEAARSGTVKEAHDYGAAICDGFMQRLELYEKVAAEAAEKRAAEKAAYNETFNAVTQQIHKVASAHWLSGYQTVHELLQ